MVEKIEELAKLGVVELVNKVLAQTARADEAEFSKAIRKGEFDNHITALQALLPYVFTKARHGTFSSTFSPNIA